ncbi:uncharacterized protein [Phaseolus vulgaris]|uniref:uncharacterized protein isoform X1 n=1 Tax=Phaseolus vulgaris TaxID=3885 RepID=UPI0035CA1985
MISSISCVSLRLSHIIKLNQICSSGEKDYCYAGQCYLIKDMLWKMFRLMFLQFEFGNFVSKICNGSGKIHKRGKHADDEKGKVPESLRQMNNLSQNGPELELCGTIIGVEEEHRRTPMKHFPNSCGERRKTAETMGRGSSRLATFGFCLCSLYLKYSKPVLQAQPPHPLWLDIIGMLSFTLFASAASVMLLVEASFTHMQIIVMLAAFFTMLLA